MSAGSARCLDSARHVLLRWSDSPDSPSREEVVEVLETHLSEAVVSSSLQLSEDTEVSLTGRLCNEIGIVRSCRAEGNSFLLTIGIGPESAPRDGEIDPGVFAIEDFLTEEQEEQILKDLDEELSRFSLSRAWQYLRWLIMRPFPA